MNILAYAHLHRLENPTGVGRVIDMLVQKLAQTDHLEILACQADIDVVVPNLAPAWRKLVYHGFKHSVSRQQLLWMMPGGRNAERWWPDADLVFSPSESYVPTRTARSAVTIHDTAYFDSGAHRASKSVTLQKLKWTLLHAKIAKQVDLIHTVSQFSAERLAHFFPAMAPRIRVVHNGISDFFFEQATEGDSEIVSPINPDRRPFVLVPGGLSFRKNADLILAAWPTLAKSHPDLQMIVTSKCDADYITAASALPSIKLVGFVDDRVLRALYRNAELVWFPSRYEGFGIPVIEAMACGTPVVTSDSSSLPEIGGDAVIYAGFDDVGAQVSAVDAVLNDPKLATSLSAKGLARAPQFRWSEAAAKLRNHFIALI